MPPRDGDLANAFCISITAPVSILRHPVDRAVSQFYYIGKFYPKISEKNLTEFMNDAQMMSNFWSVWFDGQVTFSQHPVARPLRIWEFLNI